MPSSLISLSNHKKQFQTPEMKVPVVFHASENLLIKEKTLKQFENLAKNRDLFHHIAALSDIHEKKGGYVPAGVITASENRLFPQLIDTAPNCGMRMILTDLSPRDIVEERVEELFKLLRGVIPTKKYIGTSIPQNIIFEVFRQGSKAITDYFSVRIKDELENTFKKGDMFDCGDSENTCTRRDIRNVIPPLLIKMARYRLGILGATGSHFLYLFKVREIFDKQKAEKSGIFPEQYVFFMHTGSGIIGRYIASLYTPDSSLKFLNKKIVSASQLFFNSQMKKVFRHLRKKLKLAGGEEELFGYDDQSIEGRMFITAHRAAANFGFANRTMISHNLDLALEKIHGRQVKLELLYDTPHVFIDKEKHFEKNVWVHRNGAARALAGEPVIVAPLENTLFYLGAGANENESTFFSANHEVGKIGEINLGAVSDSATATKNGYAFQVYRKNKIYTENRNELYQNYAENIIKEMEANKIMKVVASFQPIAKLTY